MSDDRDLYPIPLEAQVFIAAMKKPLAASAVAATPFAGLSYALSVLDMHPFNLLIVESSLETPLGGFVHFLAPFIAITATIYGLLMRPY